MAVFPELPPILDHVFVRVTDLNAPPKTSSVLTGNDIDAPEKNAIEVGVKWTF